ncbi:gliding motility lipoprotein GldB [Algibacter pacificus]|uniref:gliding motility lipoprotein GldB n=1 Tax=Algibacter pacificus TaxID=2599389 RepID=UPI0011CAA77D|nr:gliding motility lipoprotein GldB [Algibacter pacificus]
MKPLTLFIIILFSFFSCKHEDKIEAAIAQQDVNISVERFDRLFAKTNKQNLPSLKNTFPFMFPKNVNDSVWIEKTKDTLQQELFSEVEIAFPKFDETEKDIENLFNHIQYYFSEFTPPRVITTTSNVDYRNRVIVTDTIALIALDTYLGSSHRFYASIPRYIANYLKKDQIVVDLARAYAEKYTFQSSRKTLLDEMIYFGKVLYFQDRVIPFVLENERIGYTETQLNWAKNNESSVWQYFVERELLFSTDNKLPSRFINPAPFSKFYLEGIDRESPGKIGQYIGWQIVKAYIKHNDTSFKAMLIMNAEDIFNKSKFKPRKNNG